MNGNKYKILIIEDDEHINNLVATLLEANGYQTLSAYSCEDGMMMYASHRPDLVVLDLGLPDLDGTEVIQKIRTWSAVPILVISARTQEQDKALALDLGADDYITKPFKLGELCSRIRALLRRAGLSTQGTGAVMECGDIKIDLLGSRVLLKGKILELTAAEYRLICLLVKNANRIITRDIILDELWDSTGDYVDNNTLSVYVRRLREKIETDPSHPEHLLTVRGFGYQWKEVDE